MLLNIIVILFLLLMAYWWSTQGAFSALLHLVMVIVAGTLALAVWEPATMLLLGLPEIVAENIRFYAWGLGLLLPFVVLLILLRSLADRLVRGNVQLHGLVSQLLGGALGVASAVLTAGLTIIALNFLGGAPPLAGYQPYAPTMDGSIQRNPDGGGLWLPVDRWTTAFYNRLSQGGFGDGLGHRTPLAAHRPDLATEAAVFTMRFDDHASLVAGQGSVVLNRAYTARTRQVEALDDIVVEAIGGLPDGARIVVVETDWYDRDGAYDADSTLRITPTQISLLTHAPTAGNQRRPSAEIHRPLAYTRVRDDRQFHPVDGPEVMAAATAAEARFGWVFVVPEDHELVALYARQLRLPITQQVDSPEEIHVVLGAPAAAPEPGEDDREPVETVTGEAEEIEVTNSLPRAISRNEATGLRYEERDEAYYVVSGRTEVGRPPHGIARTIRTDAIHEPGHMVTIRLRVQGQRAQSLYGRIALQAQQLPGVHLIDDRGNTHYPIGYAWEKGRDAMEINFQRGQHIRSASQLPVTRMGDEHQLYLYFQVGRDERVTITGYQVGNETREGLNIPIR